MELIIALIIIFIVIFLFWKLFHRIGKVIVSTIVFLVLIMGVFGIIGYMDYKTIQEDFAGQEKTFLMSHNDTLTGGIVMGDEPVVTEEGFESPYEIISLDETSEYKKMIDEKTYISPLIVVDIDAVKEYTDEEYIPETTIPDINDKQTIEDFMYVSKVLSEGEPKLWFNLVKEGFVDIYPTLFSVKIITVLPWGILPQEKIKAVASSIKASAKKGLENLKENEKVIAAKQNLTEEFKSG